MNSVKSGSVKILTAYQEHMKFNLFITLENIFVSFVFNII